VKMSDSESQIDQVDEAADKLEEAGQDITNRTRRLARIYVVAVFSSVVVLLGLSVVTGIINIGTFTIVGGEVNIGTAFQWMVNGLVALFLFSVASAILISLPFTFWSRVLSTVARLADSYNVAELEE
jgi:hypothetical protein